MLLRDGWINPVDPGDSCLPSPSRPMWSHGRTWLLTNGSLPVPMCREPLLEMCAQSWVSSLQTTPATEKNITIHITYCSFYVSNLCFPAQTGCPCGERAFVGQNNPLGASGCIPCSHNLSLVFLLSSP